MRIGMVLAKPFPPDIRVMKEAKALIAAGFKVGLLARSRDHAETPRETTSYGLSIYRSTISRQSIWLRQVKSITALEKDWLEPLERFIADFEPQVLHVHDFPFVKTALTVAEPLCLPVVADLHENMPAAYRIWRQDLAPLRRAKDTILRNYYLWRWHERRVLPRCARIIVVVREAAERLDAYGIDKSKIVVISNTEDETTFSLSEPKFNILKQYEKKWVASYVGGVGPHRGIDTALQAVPMVAEQIPDFCLLIVGAKGKSQFKKLTELAKLLGIEEHVEILGWQSFEKVSSYISASEACLVPHNDSEHTQTTVPHKLFQYMLAGKPVVVSNVRPLKRIVEETNAGVVFQAGDPSSLARALLTLYRDVDRRERLGRNGSEAAKGPYSWKRDAERLINLYRTLSM